MTLNTTPGSPDADAYVDLETAHEYATKRGLAFPVEGEAKEPAEQAIRRATAAIDALYGQRFLGQAASASQSLEWPRAGVIYRGELLPDNEIPAKVVNATIEFAVRELAEPGSLTPDLERGGAIKSLQAGSVGIVYMDGATPQTVFQSVDGLLTGLIGPKPGSVMFGTTARM